MTMFHTRSLTLGFPGCSLGLDEGRGGSGGTGLPADSGVPGRPGDDGPEENSTLALTFTHLHQHFATCVMAAGHCARLFPYW